MRIATVAPGAAIVVTLAIAGCGEPTSQSRGTAAPSSARPSAPAEDGSGAVAAERPAAAVEPAPPAPRTAAAAVAPAATEPRQVDGLTVRRFVISHDVENREPVGAASPFRASSDPVYAFVELRNEAVEARRVQVVFRSEDGLSLGPVDLEVPANAPRWRTWARSGLRRPGTWTVLVQTPEGEVLGSTTVRIES